jgi:hypothetical protein
LVPQFVGRIPEFMKSEFPVNQSYAAACVEKLLQRKVTSKPNGGFIFNPQNMDPEVLRSLFTNICNLLQSQKNLYAIRSLYRTVSLAQGRLAEYGETLGSVLKTFILEAAKDQSQSSPNYLYILFETTALTLRYLKDNKPVFAQVEAALLDSLCFVI